MQGKVQNWQNWWSLCLDSKYMLIVLNIILCWFCSTMLQQNHKLYGNWKIRAMWYIFKALLACCQSFFGFLARHFIFVKPVKNGCCPSKWSSWQVLAKALIHTNYTKITAKNKQKDIEEMAKGQKRPEMAIP